MRSLVKASDGIHLKEYKMPELKKGFVRINVKEVGLCRTDLFVADGTIKVDQDIILGHEFSGIIVETKSTLFKVNERVSVNPLFDVRFMGLDFDGCLRDFIDVPEEQVIRAFDLDFKVAAYLEPVAASMAVLKVCHDKKAKGAVFGYNRIAELTYIILKEEGYNIEWIDEKNITAQDNEYDYVIETLLNEVYLSKIIKLLKKEGTLVVKSRKKQLTGLVASDLVAKELTLRCVNYYDFNKTMEWLISHQNTISHLLGDSYPLDDWRNAFDEANKGESKKIFIHI